MANINVSIPHNIGVENARSRVTGLVQQLKNQYGGRVSDVKESWDGNRGHYTFNAMGFNVDLNISVENDRVNVEGNLPMAALPFKSQIENTIREQGGALLR